VREIPDLDDNIRGRRRPAGAERYPWSAAVSGFPRAHDLPAGWRRRTDPLAINRTATTAAPAVASTAYQK
jgi:hypothetical protein